MIDKAATGRTTVQTPRELAKKSLGQQNGSPFTQRVVDAPPPRKFSVPKFTVYDGKSDPADHIRYYQQVMAYWVYDDAVMCRMFPSSWDTRHYDGFIGCPKGA